MFILKELNRLLNDEDGLTVVEYAIAGGLVAAGVVTAFVGLGDNVEIVISDLCTELGAAATNTGATTTGTCATQ